MRQMNVLTMILAGGIGERLYPLTANRSKPAVPFGANFRIIDFTLGNCVLSGLRRIHVLTQYHSLSLGQHQSERWNFLSPELGEFVKLVPPKLRTATGFYQGTSDALYRNLDLLDAYRPDVVLVLSGDHIYRADYRRFIEAHLERDADITVLTGQVPPEEASSFGVINFDGNGRIQSFIEKPKDPSPYASGGHCHINLGVYCFQTRFLVHQLVHDSKKKTAHDFGKNILPGSLAKGTVLSCPLEAICPDDRPYWRDVGTIDSYFQASMDLLDSPPAFHLRDPRWARGSRFEEWLPAKISTTAQVNGRIEQGRSFVGSGCDLEPASILRCVLSPGVRIGQGSEVHDSILFAGVEVGEGSRLSRVIVEEGVHIPPGTVIGHGGDSRRFIISPGGVVVVAAGYRFEEPGSRRPAAAPPPSYAQEAWREHERAELKA
jgi:glucose-1-phosphate adenylyltransferase